MSIEVRDVSAQHRYEAVLDGQVAGFVDYALQRDATGEGGRDSVLILVHTEVDPAFDGRGVGGALARAALDDARARGLRVVPRCAFIAAWLRRHPAYADLVAG